MNIVHIPHGIGCNSTGVCGATDSRTDSELSGVPQLYSPAPCGQNPDFLKLINARNGKILALLIVLSLAAYHGCIHLFYGIETCRWILTSGRFQGDHVWQPYGCMLHTYSNNEARQCLRYVSYWGGRSHFVFVGDSRVRQLYYSLVRLSKPFVEDDDGAEGGNNRVAELPVHHDLIHEETKLHTKIEFFWQPVVNGSMYAIFERWLGGSSRKDLRANSLQPPPTLLIAASATWTIKQSNGSLDALDEYRRNVSGLASLMDRLNKAGTQVFWVLQDPVDHDKLDESRKMITNRMLDLYNEAALEAFSYTDVQIFSAVKHIAGGYYDRDQYRLWDGLHTSNFTVDYAIQLLYNMYCNDKMRWDDCTCCARPEALTALQKITMACFGFVFLLAVLLFVRDYLLCHRLHGYNLRKSGRGYYGYYGRYMPLHSAHQRGARCNRECTRLIYSLSKLGLIMGYFLICDRTDFFLKENKYFTQLNFFLPICYVFALGLFFTEDLKSQSKFAQVKSPASFTVASPSASHTAVNTCSQGKISDKRCEENGYCHLPETEGNAVNSSQKTFSKYSDLKHQEETPIGIATPTEENTHLEHSPRRGAKTHQPRSTGVNGIDVNHQANISNAFSDCDTNVCRHEYVVRHTTRKILSTEELPNGDWLSAGDCVKNIDNVINFGKSTDRTLGKFDDDCTADYDRDNISANHPDCVSGVVYCKSDRSASRFPTTGATIGFASDRVSSISPDVPGVFAGGTILNRKQTLEWKGWMQLVLLIYHMTGASKVIPIYMHVRLLVTSYLFLTGYNHFSHYWAGGDSSVFRLARVVFRLNLLVFVLCLSMNRPYQFYYFIPLVTFCTLLVHVFVVLLPPRVTAASVEQQPVHNLYMVLKFVALFTAISVLYTSQVLFERIFLVPPWKALFVTSPGESNVREWYFRWKIDRYSTPCGMLFAFLLHTARRRRIIQDGWSFTLSTIIQNGAESYSIIKSEVHETTTTRAGIESFNVTDSFEGFVTSSSQTSSLPLNEAAVIGRSSGESSENINQTATETVSVDTNRRLNTRRERTSSVCKKEPHWDASLASPSSSPSLSVNIVESRSAMLGLLIFSAIALLSATAFAFRCGEKPACNEVLPYVSWLPILGYIILRNAYGPLRARYSALFAWVGELSLELFVCQYHVWLSAGTHGVLVLIPKYPVANVCVTSFVLVAIAHEVRHLTTHLVRFAVPQPPPLQHDGRRKLLRNVIILLIVLLPIGIHDKML